MTEGRSCPLAYRYSAGALCQEPRSVSEDVLYIIGGLYGNPWALDEIEQMALAEERQGHRVRLVFNGDFNWFNVSDSLFRNINNRVLDHTVSLGNVDYELAQPQCRRRLRLRLSGFRRSGRCGAVQPHHGAASGCCRGASRIFRRRLSLLPRYRCLIFGGLKVLVVHGDPESLAGWGLAHEAFAEGNDNKLSEWFLASEADVIASTHTCLPVLWSGLVGERSRVVANNGAAGMGNLQSGPPWADYPDRPVQPRGIEPVAGFSARACMSHCCPWTLTSDAWLPQFDRLWPAGSPAAVSYRNRILEWHFPDC